MHGLLLIIDTTAAEQKIKYPTDLGLLNDTRLFLEGTIDAFYQVIVKHNKDNKDDSMAIIPIDKPRDYRQVARKEYLTLALKRRKSAKEIRRVNKKQLIYDEYIKLLFDFADKNKRHPRKSDIENDISLGEWLQNKKSQIKTTSDQLYIDLAKHPIIKAELDDYLKRTILSTDDMIALLFEYANEYETAPTHSTIYQAQKIGIFLQNKKKLIKTSNCDMYKTLSSNIYIKKNIDDYLEKKLI